MNKWVIICIDGLGIGQMPDSTIKANTWETVVNNSNESDFPFLKKIMKNRKKVALDYQGADSFLGHLTMSGIKTESLSLLPLSNYLEEISTLLNNEKIAFEVYKGIIKIEDKLLIYDNFEADHGLAINIIGNSDKINWNNQIDISKKIRKIIRNPRLITFAAKGIDLATGIKIISEEGFNGIKTAETGVYNDSFIVEHLSAIKDFSETIQYKLAKKHKVCLYGKFANIINIDNCNVKKNKEIDIKQTFQKLFTNNNCQYHFINIQQTDLAGHKGNVSNYIDALNEIDQYLERLYIGEYHFILISDHGNDPAVNNGKHTREFVPLITNFDFDIGDEIKLSNLPKIINSK